MLLVTAAALKLIIKSKNVTMTIVRVRGQHLFLERFPDYANGMQEITGPILSLLFMRLAG